MTDAARTEMASGLAPWSLKNAPSFIERQFPVGRLSAEAYKERKAGAGQTLTALGSYWKGRKPLILVRAVVLGCLLPATADAAADLAVFLKLMAMDDAAFGRRFDGGPTAFARLFPDHAEAVATDIIRQWRADLPADEMRARAARLCAEHPAADAARRPMLDALAAFARSDRARKPAASAVDFAALFPDAADTLTEDAECRWRWRDDVPEQRREALIAEAFATLPYAERLAQVRRPEECGEALLAPVWPSVSRHLGTRARSLPELVAELGIARFGHRPRLADTFCGGGSIPFEAARVGCDVYASDLNPIACMLTWGAFNIIGAPAAERAALQAAQERIADAVDAGITRLRIEHDAAGNRAKAYLYCLETRCPKTGWMVPMAPSWVISKTRNVIARLVPDPVAKRYRIEIHSGVSSSDMAAAELGTIRAGRLIHPMNDDRSGVEIRTIRGDYRDEDGRGRNQLRLWHKADFVPAPDDVFQERLYCIQWVTAASLHKGRQVIFFAAPTDADLGRERRVERIVRDHLAAWQEDGLAPDMPIEPGDETTRLFRERGWTHWHHLFSARNLLGLALLLKEMKKRDPAKAILTFPIALDNASRLCGWNKGHPGSGEFATNVFNNQAFNTQVTYACRSVAHIAQTIGVVSTFTDCAGSLLVAAHPASGVAAPADMFVTDPPYADAVNYHEITEFFIAWLRRNPPPPFDQWCWDSRRAQAIKGRDEQFRRDMVAAYAAMTRQMPENGLQVVMFTHQDAGVWADLGAILWAAGLSVTAAWNVVTETDSALKAGNYVQGTVCLVLRKRAGAANARRMEIEAEIETAVAAQLAHLNALDDAWHERSGAETLYTDGDLTLAAYAAALQVVTAYATIDREPLDRDLYRRLARGETTMLRGLIDYAAAVANGILVPEGFPRALWRDLASPERFYVRMLDMEAKGAAKVADFQNFARSFAFAGYAELMASAAANAAALAGAADLKGRMLAGEGFWSTELRQVLFAIWKTMEGAERDPRRGVTILRGEYAADYWQRRQRLTALAQYVALKTSRTRPEESAAAAELAEALKLDRV